MEQRSFEIRASDTEKREVSGVAVPYNETIDIGGGWSERFEKGAVDTDADVKLFRDHKEIIGVVNELREEEDGLWITAKISDTALGNETMELVKDGAIRSFSVGFIPVKDEKKDKTIIRKKVDLKEVSLVAFPAYEAAAVLAVREEVKEEIMTENTTPDYDAAIAEVRNHAEALERRLDVLSTSAPATPSVPTFRSFGDWAKGVASQKEDAITLYRAFENAESGSVLADSILKNAWVSDTIRILNAGRPTFTTFSSAALPADGMTIEYPLLDTDTSDIAEQAAEADELAFGKITLTSATAPVKTYGGYTDMSRQVIERSSINYVDAAFRAMVAKYASVTNGVMRAKLIAEAANFNTASVAAWSADAMLEALADSAVKVNDDTGLPLQFILASSDVFKSLAKLVDGADRPILSNTGATVNTFGSINPVGLTANILGLPVVVDPSLAAGSMYVGNSAAVTSYESAGAPFRLNDEDITNLTNKFSVYGYLAVACQDPKALVKVANPND
jgi:HK97 family phage prohead protease